MLTQFFVFGLIVVYMGLLLTVALWAERRIGRGGWNPARNPLVYSLGIALFCTSWTYYGSVGYAVNRGYSYLAIYVGPTLTFMLGGILLQRLVHLKERHRITSIADLISARYGWSQPLAALVTVGALVGITPYIALQLRSITTSLNIVAPPGSGPLSSASQAVPLVVVLLAAFTIVAGVRRIDPTERHQGMIMAIAVESVVKLVAFLAAGFFVTYGLFDGFGDIFDRAARDPGIALPTLVGQGGATYMSWGSLCLLSMMAVLFLPRQFHVAVVENSEEKHIRTAMWAFPLYMLVINVFVIPIALGGLLRGLPTAQADSFVLRLPLESGQPLLVLLVFIGGFSAATGMVMVSAMTLSTMITNHLMMPLILKYRVLAGFKRHLLEFRWLAVVAVIGIGYVFELGLGGSYLLVSIGLISFAATAQFVPAIVLGLFWRGANRRGAMLGMSAGFAVWFYTLLVPAIARSDWLPMSLVEDGPGGLAFLRPEQLFGLHTLDPLSQAVFWSLLVNLGFTCLGSVLSRPDEADLQQAAAFVGDGDSARTTRGADDGRTVSLAAKVGLIDQLLGTFFSPPEALAMRDRCLRRLGLGTAGEVPLRVFANLVHEIEISLAGSLGGAAARSTLSECRIFTQEETEALTRQYSRLLADMNLSPEQMGQKIDYLRERQDMLQEHAGELEDKIAQRDREIAVRERAEQALREAEENLRNIFFHAAEGIFQTTIDGEILGANPALARILGFATVEELMASVTSLPDQVWVDREQRERMLEILRRDGRVEDFLLHFRRKDGSKGWGHINARAIRDAGGEFVTVEGFYKDITARVEAERERERMQEQLLQAQKMEAVGKLAGGVAHDFNNLLTAILGFAELARMDVRDTDPLASNLDSISATCRRAANLVRQLLLFSRKQPMDRRPVNLNELVDGMQVMLERLLGENIDIRTHLDEDLWPVRGDTGNLEQILLNLVVNARDAMPDGGTITIASARCEIDAETAAAVEEARPGSFVCLSVGDTGEGMDQRTVDQIFEPFYSTKDAGTGLGLAVVYGIVKSHEGWLQVSSDPGRGTTMEVYLPVSEDVFDEPAADAGKPQPAAITGRILLVEDESAVRALACAILERAGHQVFAAADLAEARRLYAAEHGAFDLVLSDVALPDGNGIDLVEEFQSHDPRLPVIFSSGYADEKSRLSVIRRRGHTFVPKPYHVQALVDEVARVLTEAAEQGADPAGREKT